MSGIPEIELGLGLPTPQADQWPGCAIAVLKDGDIVQSHCSGLASVEHGVEIGLDTVFRIASITKQFLCAALVDLSRNGQLSLDAPLSKFVPLHANLQGVTIRQAMSNTSGLRDHIELWYMAGGGLQVPHRLSQSLALSASQTGVNFEPGSRFLYSNANFLLLTEVVELVSGESLPDFLNRRFFKPLGMTRTALHNNHFDIIPDMATGYVIDEHGALKRGRMTMELCGDGAAVSCLNDLAKWVRYYQEDPDQLIAEMASPLSLANGKSCYGLGLFHESWAGLDIICHTGLWPGYLTEILYIPSEGIGVITLANVNTYEPTVINRSILEQLFPERSAAQPQLALDDLQWKAAQDEGLWVDPETLDLAEFAQPKSGVPMMQTYGFGARLRAVGATKLVPDFKRSDYRAIDISRASDGSIGLEILNGEILSLVPAASLVNDHWIDHYGGVWWCAEIDTKLVLARTESGFDVETPGFRGHDWSSEILPSGILMLKEVTGPWPRRFYLFLETRQDGETILIVNGPRVRRFEYMRLGRAEA